jgi:hypothetical protein
MASLSRLVIGCLGLAILADPRSAVAAGHVKLELFTDQRAPITSQQQWLRRLAEVGVTDLRIHTGGPGDKVGVENLGTEADPLYRVTGMITSDSDLVLPGGRFRPSDAAQVARWLNNLARKGIERNKEPRSPFGLTRQQFEKAVGDLSQAVGFSTRGLSRRQAVGKLSERLGVPLRLPRGRVEGDSEDRVSEELSGVTCGTALACLLRPWGLGFAPRADDRGELEYAAAPIKRGAETWPIGWPVKKPLPKVVPAMYKSFSANIQNVSLATVLDALAKRLKIPFLLDHNALARRAIDPDAIKVNVPRSRTTCNRLLRRVLFHAGLKSEVRVDEADEPLVWITAVRPP